MVSGLLRWARSGAGTRAAAQAMAGRGPGARGVASVLLFAVAFLVLVLAGCRARDEGVLTPAGLAARTKAIMWGGSTRVSDARILSCLLDYLREARPADRPEGERWITRTLVFELRDGRETQHAYLVRELSPPTPGYLEFPQGWYEVPVEFGIVLEGLEGYPGASGDVDAGDADLLHRYGWTAAFRINTLSVTLPSEFRHRPGEYPEVLYWAYNNELSRDAGLDISPVLGQTVEARLYKVAEPLPEFMHPRREAGRAVVVRHQGRIVGAWLDAGRHYGFACSLKGRPFEEVTGKTWEEWIPALIDPDDPVEKELARLSPEELIRAYFQAVDRGDHARAHACESRRLLTSHLFSNMDNDGLYNPGYRDDEPGGLSNITSARVISIRRLEGFEEQFRDAYPPGTRLYQVEVDFRVRQVVTFDSGRQPRFVTVKRETEATGWRIEGVGTGP